MVDTGIQATQIIGLLFSLVMLYFTFLHYKRGEFRAEVFMFWLLLWISFAVTVIYPQSFDILVRGLKLGRRLDFFVIFGFLLLTALVYNNYLLVNKTKRSVEIIVRKVAFRNAKDARKR